MRWKHDEPIRYLNVQIGQHHQHQRINDLLHSINILSGLCTSKTILNHIWEKLFHVCLTEANFTPIQVPWLWLADMLVLQHTKLRHTLTIKAILVFFSRWISQYVCIQVTVPDLTNHSRCMDYPINLNMESTVNL